MCTYCVPGNMLGASYPAGAHGQDKDIRGHAMGEWIWLKYIVYIKTQYLIKLMVLVINWGMLFKVSLGTLSLPVQEKTGGLQGSEGLLLFILEPEF